MKIYEYKIHFGEYIYIILCDESSFKCNKKKIKIRFIFEKKFSRVHTHIILFSLDIRTVIYCISAIVSIGSSFF